MKQLQLFLFNFRSNISTLTVSLEQALQQALNNPELTVETLRFEHTQDFLKCRLTVTSTKQLRTAIAQMAQDLAFDYCLLTDQQAQLEPKLVVFDMDSTLIPIEVIDQLGEQAQVKAQISSVTEAAMRGELDFNQSLIQRVALLKGLPLTAIEQVKLQLNFNPGVERFCHSILAAEGDVCIASGGFTPFAKHLARQIPFAEIHANNLLDDNEVLTGEVTLPIVNAQVKAESLRRWRDKRHLGKMQTVAIGDGANDLLMLQEAGLGIAYKAKPAVNEQADCVIRYGEMDSLIDLFAAIKNHSLQNRN
ncbi:MAG: phosphoserine phosphatase SerB [Kangiellaceae bacterium]|nr:phosphoserine phosphatase SerB [Kangiellaceae bacterium]